MIRLCYCYLALAPILIVQPAEAPKRQLSVNLETPEGVLLKQALDEADAAKKSALMEEFAAKHPAHESAAWVLGELRTSYRKANQFDQAIAAGEKAMASDPDDFVIAHATLKAAERPVSHTGCPASSPAMNSAGPTP